MSETADNLRIGAFTGLAAALSPLVGREREVTLAMDLLRRDDVRLLTLTGAGGIGKTRLGMEVAKLLQDDFADGVRVVSLAAVRDASLVASTIWKSLNHLHSSLGPDPGTLIPTLPDAELLLVLDNFEHLLEAAPVVTDMLRACPRIKVLATSRAPLRVSGEYALPVPPLGLPEPAVAASVDDVSGTAAVRLFVDRARARVAGFTLTPGNAADVAAICHRLDGLPLAIELAASQIAVLSPGALLTRITAGEPLPVSGPRDAPDRQRTMRNTIAWSYALLGTDEQRLFRLLSVFAGGFQLEAAEAVNDGVTGMQDVLTGLANLVDTSLLRHSGDTTFRFTMLETIRAFAQEELVANGERDMARDAHANWCLTLAAQTRMALIMPGGKQQLSLLEREHGNIRAALEWLDEQGDAELLLRLIVDLGGFYYEHSHYREGRRWLERALAVTAGTPSTLRAHALVRLGLLLMFPGEFSRARELVDEGVAMLRHGDDISALALALIWQGAIRIQLGKLDEAEQALEEALELATTLPNEQAITIHVRALSNLGTAAHARGDLETATTRHEMALRICREHGYVLGLIRALGDLGDVARDQADYARSLACYQECLSLMDRHGDLRLIVDALEGTALAAAAWNQGKRAARLLGAATELGKAFGVTIFLGTDRAAHDRAVNSARAIVSEHDFDKAFTSGRQLGLEDAMAEVQAMTPPGGTGPLPGEPDNLLSSREIEILLLVAEGNQDREIAGTLFLSVRTVEAHMANIRARLGVRTRTAAVATAIATGIIHPHRPPRD